MKHDAVRMDQRLLDILRCPADGATLLVDSDRSTPDGEQPSLVCSQCTQRYPVHHGIPRFVVDDQYAGNFSYEWTVHSTTQLDSEAISTSERTFAQKTGWCPADIRGKRILDVGCGMGRFADVVLKWGGEVVGLDLSFSVDAAQDNLGSNPNFHAIQASVLDLPFRSASFDLIYSIGVLTFTPDCEKAFKSLPRLLRPGGEIAIWVYSAHSYPPDGVVERRDRFYRRYATRMPPRLLYMLCRILCLVPLRPHAFWHMVLPGFVFHAIPRLHHQYPDYRLRVLDTFDWYSPQYQSKHSFPEVYRWFCEAGLVDIKLYDVEISARGRKPAEKERPAGSG